MMTAPRARPDRFGFAVEPVCPRFWRLEPVPRRTDSPAWIRTLVHGSNLSHAFGINWDRRNASVHLGAPNGVVGRL